MIGFQILEDIWNSQQRHLVMHCYGQPFWHCGNMAVATAVKQDEPLWGYSNPAVKLNYAGWAKSMGPAWLYESKNCRTLKLAYFGGASLAPVAHSNNNSHVMMKKVIFRWLTEKKLDGIFAMNGSQDEIVVNRPTWDLDPVSFTPI